MMPKTPSPILLSGAEADVLSAHLDDEIRVQEELLSLLVEKGKALVANDVPALTQSLANAGTVVSRLQETTCRRERLVRNLARAQGLREEDTRFSVLGERAPADSRPRIVQSIAKLKTLIATTEVQNRKNRMLVKVGLEVNEALVRSLFGDANAVATYDRGAKARTSKPTRPYLSTEL